MTDASSGIELSTFSDEIDDSIVQDINEEEGLVKETEEELSNEPKSFEWVESRKYWYALLHIVVTVFGISVIILLGLSAPGLWKLFNHDTNCEIEATGGYIAPSNPFTFSDMMLLSPEYPMIHWIASESGDAWVSLHVLPDTEFKQLLKYSFPSEVVRSSDTLDEPLQPDEAIFYPVTAYPQDASVFIISPDGKYILFGFDKVPIYRHSYFARWEICDTKTYTCWDLTESQESDIRHIQWSQENKLSYVRNNDLWIVTDVSGNTQNNTIQVTSDGQYAQILNGASDWAYEEEVFESSKANYWSPGSNHLAYVKFQEQNVKLYNFSLYHTNASYPELYKYKYPCAGERSSVVSLWIFDLDTNETRQVPLPADPEQYITYLAWSNEESLAFQILNRLQQQQTLFRYSLATSEQTIVTIQQDSRWIDPYYKFLAIHNSEFILMQPRNGFKHLIIFDTNGNEISDINDGELYDVADILHFDESTETLYYSMHHPTPSDLNIFARKLISKNSICISGGEKTFASATFSPSAEYFALYNYGIDIPTVAMVSSSSHEALYVLEDNKKFADAISELAMPTRKYLEIPAAEGKEMLSVVLYLPPGFDEEEEIEYPVIFYVYGGPDSQTVNFEFEMGFWYLHSFLASSMGVIVASVDNRGTCCKGQEFLKQTYLDLGDVEVDDQIAAMHTLGGLKYVDESRIGIWGWSYGAYMSSRVISEGDSIVRGAVSVSPVTDWKFYDSIYTERYMQTPDLNVIGYEESSVLGRAEFINPKSSYLLVHGTADDNVHFQNSADWVTNLVQAGIDFRTMYYPDKSHSLTGLETRSHLYKLMIRFWANTFDLSVPSMSLQSENEEEEKLCSSVNAKRQVQNIHRHYKSL